MAALTLPFLGLPRWLWAVLALVGLVGAFIAWDALDDRAAVKSADQAREAKAGDARETAADERVADTIINTRSEEELHHAIDTAPTGGQLSPAARALACERLRRIGRVPPDCRPAGGDGSQAAPD